MILTSNPRAVTGRCFVDEDVLRDAGETDFDRYRNVPDGSKVQLDVFIDPD